MKKRSQILFSGLSILALSACAKAPAMSDKANVRQLSDDFYVTQLSGRPAAAVIAAAITTTPGVPITRADCEAHLTKAICVTSATTDEISQYYGSIQCDSDNSQFVPALMAIYDETPAKMQLSLCTLDRVFLSDGIPSTAFASAVTDANGDNIGGYVGMRKATLLQQPSTHDLVTWKEQLAFGGATKFLSNDPKLVQINYGLKLSKLPTDGLFYVLMHEMGHLIDFKNEQNNDFGTTPWANLSWAAQKPLPSATFDQRDNFCYYNCMHYLNPSDAKAIYTSMQQSAFLSSYSSSNHWEDFAEFWAWRLLLETKSPAYEIVIPGEATLDMMPVLASNPQIKKKLDYMTNLWNNPNLQIDNRLRASPLSH